MKEKVIEIKDLKKAYKLAKARDGQEWFEAVKGTSLDVYRGEIFGILGPNGAGKTTTLEIIEGLKDQSSGTVKVLGFDNLKEIDEIKKRIGVQLQSSDYLPSLTLGELIDLFRSLYPTTESAIPGVIPNAAEGSQKRDSSPRTRPYGTIGPGMHSALNDAEKRQHLLRLVNLEDKEHEQVKNLSGGQKQRFTIATTLVNDPEIIFLDEPTTGLDPSARRNLWELIKNINARGITVVLTTHYMEEAEYLCHRVAIMDSGKILEIDEPKKLIDNLSKTTQITFLTDKPVDEKIFQSFPEIEKIYNQFPKVTLEISSLDHVSKIVQLLKDKRISFSGFTARTASLEDVYLDLTGKTYEG